MCNIRTDTGERDRKSQITVSHYTYIRKILISRAAQRAMRQPSPALKRKLKLTTVKVSLNILCAFL